MSEQIQVDSVLVVGSGPIVIGQAAEFDYSGSQACKALREEGYRVILVNSNPATIQTDPEMADRIYIEPLTAEVLTEIIERERPDAFLGTLGGQTGLNLTMQLSENNVFEQYGVQVLGTEVEQINVAEDRDRFRRLMRRLDEPITTSRAVNNLDRARDAAREIGFPVIVRPAYTLGGTGGGVAHNINELETIARRGLDRSQVTQVLIEKSLLGWKEFEYELMRDGADNCMIVCNMENLDPMGVHTGESIVTAPAQTLSDRDHQTLRNAAMKIVRALEIRGGCNIQFAVDPETRDYYVVEVNPRVSRSSALASKVTGYPIAKIAAQIATGLRLDQIPNDITRDTRACFEPALDYVVVKIPRWPFDRFPGAERELTTQMKSTGETMAIGRGFEEALQKALASLDVSDAELCGGSRTHEVRRDVLEDSLETPTDRRIHAVYDALRTGMSVRDVNRASGISTFFLYKIQNIVEMEQRLRDITEESMNEDDLRQARRLGFTDRQLATLLEADSLESLDSADCPPVYKMVDTCAAEFEARTPYFYSTRERRDEVEVPAGESILVLGSGPIRIGQGIEFDYCCVHASQSLRNAGVQSIMINNNPETVSTDYDTSDRLYFEPLTVEHVMNVVEKEQPRGVIVQFGGQTPLNLARELEQRGVKILGTSPSRIHQAENRRAFSETLEGLGIPQPEGAMAHSVEEAHRVADRIGYPVLVRPSFVIGGRSMMVVHEPEELDHFISRAVAVGQDHPVLIDDFLEDALEVDVDAVSDGSSVFIGGILEHIEQAGVHSGDSACVLPPQSLDETVLDTIRDHTRQIARSLEVVGLLNLQFAVQDGTVYLLEANPRASRTVPFVSKATGVSLVKLATRTMLGERLPDPGALEETRPERVAVKEAVFPFGKLPGVDPVLGPEMKSTGEVMGLDREFSAAFYKAQQAAGNPLPLSGRVLLSISDRAKPDLIPLARRCADLGFELLATRGTARALHEAGLEVQTVKKLSEGHPNIIDRLREHTVDWIINLPTSTRRAQSDGFAIRRHAIDLDIPYITTTAAARAAVDAIDRARNDQVRVMPLVESSDPEPVS